MNDRDREIVIGCTRILCNVIIACARAIVSARLIGKRGVADNHFSVARDHVREVRQLPSPIE